MALLHTRASDTPPPLPTDNSLCIIHENYTSLTPLTLHTDAHTDNRYGRFPHNALLSLPLGRRWHTSTPTPHSAGFVYALHPNPILWSLALNHRTQIVYPHDVALILSWLGVAGGMKVVECGTGSGAMTCSLAVAVAPKGRVMSYEYHAVRAEAAQKDLARLVGDVVQIRCADPTKEGFVGVKDADVDAVFLDMPVPYVMGAELERVLKPNATVCCFSPCLEQVSRNVAMLNNAFYDIRTVTVTARTYDTREQVLVTPGFDEHTEDETVENGLSDGDGNTRKRRRVEMTERQLRRSQKSAGQERVEIEQRGGGKHRGRVLRADVRLRSRPFSSMKGHTSYLTFARRRREVHTDGEKMPHGEKTPGVDVPNSEQQRESCAIS